MINNTIGITKVLCEIGIKLFELVSGEDSAEEVA